VPWICRIPADESSACPVPAIFVCEPETSTWPVEASSIFAEPSSLICGAFSVSAVVASMSIDVADLIVIVPVFFASMWISPPDSIVILCDCASSSILPGIASPVSILIDPPWASSENFRMWPLRVLI
jgi:hypothetical protein